MSLVVVCSCLLFSVSGLKDSGFGSRVLRLSIQVSLVLQVSARGALSCKELRQVSPARSPPAYFFSFLSYSQA